MVIFKKIPCLKVCKRVLHQTLQLRSYLRQPERLFSCLGHFAVVGPSCSPVSPVPPVLIRILTYKFVPVCFNTILSELQNFKYIIQALLEVLLFNHSSSNNNNTKQHQGILQKSLKNNISSTTD